MPFERNQRVGTSLFEVLVAFALLSLVLAMALPELSGAAARQAGRIEKLLATEFAVSLAEELRITGPHVPMTGQDPSGWSWQITKTEVAPDGATALDAVMRLVELHIEIWHRDRSQSRHTFTTIQAQRR